MDDKQIRLEQLVQKIETDFGDVDALQRLTEAVIISGHLQELSDDLVDHFVAEARTTGASWNDIGEAMGVTRQAAQKRFVGRPPKSGGLGAFFTRFGDDARTVVRGAVAIAHSVGSDHVGSEHLVSALLEDDDGTTMRAVLELGGDTAVIKETTGVSARPSNRPSRRHLPFTKEAKKALELSLREAIRGGGRRISEEHITLAILRNTGSPGELAFRAGGIGYDSFQGWVDR